ncbi:DUF1656 domain-containing protein [Salinisphaera aquimarina]|uniref:DUF1656 domain-containing protein n=1 Tax=Salinisphaera aquimarina TaxID=2094031 RepID=A0ABV7EP35_9GAMM
MWLDLVQIGGIYLPSFLVFLALATAVYLPVRWFLARVHFYRIFWHPALAEAALFAGLLASIILWLGP